MTATVIQPALVASALAMPSAFAQQQRSAVQHDPMNRGQAGRPGHATTFLAIAAHELRTPMDSFSLRIAALARLARRSGEPALAEKLERATRTIDRYRWTLRPA